MRSGRAASPLAQSLEAELLERWAQQVGVFANPQPRLWHPAIADASDAGKVRTLSQDKTTNHHAPPQGFVPLIERKPQLPQIALLVLELEAEPGAAVFDRFQPTEAIRGLLAALQSLAGEQVSDLTFK